MLPNKNIFRTLHIEMPVELIPIYEELQRIYNLILKNENFRNILLNNINYEQFRSNVFRQMHSYFQGFVNQQLEIENKTGKIEYKIPNKAWFSRMMYERLRQLVMSVYDNQKNF